VKEYSLAFIRANVIVRQNQTINSSTKYTLSLKVEIVEKPPVTIKLKEEKYLSTLTFDPIVNRFLYCSITIGTGKSKNLRRRRSERKPTSSSDRKTTKKRRS
jgi:hypothetical protein